MTTLGVQASCDASQPSDCGTARSKKQSHAIAEALAQPIFFPSLDSYGPQRAAEMELLFARLLFAARGLARARIKTAPPVVGEEDPLNYCEECHMGSLAGVLSHAANCRVGSVLGILAAICRSEESAAPVPQRRREDAPMAKDGARARAGFGEPWKTCWTDSLRDRNDVALFNSERYKLATLLGAPREAYEHSERIVACVNFCAGIPTERLERELPLASPGRRRFPEVMHLRRALPWLGYLPVEADDSAVIL